MMFYLAFLLISICSFVTKPGPYKPIDYSKIEVFEDLDKEPGTDYYLGFFGEVVSGKTKTTGCFLKFYNKKILYKFHQEQSLALKPSAASLVFRSCQSKKNIHSCFDNIGARQTLSIEIKNSILWSTATALIALIIDTKENAQDELLSTMVNKTDEQLSKSEQMELVHFIEQHMDFKRKKTITLNEMLFYEKYWCLNKKELCRDVNLLILSYLPTFDNVNQLLNALAGNNKNINEKQKTLLRGLFFFLACAHILENIQEAQETFELRMPHDLFSLDRNF